MIPDPSVASVVASASFAFPDLHLAAGAYYLTLQGATFGFVNNLLMTQQGQPANSQVQAPALQLTGGLASSSCARYSDPRRQQRRSSTLILLQFCLILPAIVVKRKAVTHSSPSSRLFLGFAATPKQQRRQRCQILTPQRPWRVGCGPATHDTSSPLVTHLLYQGACECGKHAGPFPSSRAATILWGRLVTCGRLVIGLLASLTNASSICGLPLCEQPNPGCSRGFFAGAPLM